MGKILYLSENDINSILNDDINFAVEAMYHTFEVLGSGDFAFGGELKASHGMQLKYKKNNEDALYIAMPGYVGGEYQISGLKWHGPMNNKLGIDRESNFMLTLNDAATGKPLSIMQADRITTLRTAAVNIVATEVLANNITSLGIIGPGQINMFVAKGLLKRNKNISKVFIKGRGENSLNKFINKLKEEFHNIEFIKENSVEAVVKNSDVISIMTGFQFDNISDMPNIKESWIKKGTLFLCGAFAYFADKTILGDVNRVCDLYQMYESYEQELGYPAYKSLSNLGNKFADFVKDGKLQRTDVLNLGEIFNNRNLIDRRKTTLFSSGGIVAEDIVLGKMIYEKALQCGKGIKLDWN